MTAAARTRLEELLGDLEHARDDWADDADAFGLVTTAQQERTRALLEALSSAHRAAVERLVATTGDAPHRPGTSRVRPLLGPDELELVVDPPHPPAPRSRRWDSTPPEAPPMISKDPFGQWWVASDPGAPAAGGEVLPARRSLAEWLTDAVRRRALHGGRPTAHDTSTWQVDVPVTESFARWVPAVWPHERVVRVARLWRDVTDARDDWLGWCVQMRVHAPAAVEVGEPLLRADHERRVAALRARADVLEHVPEVEWGLLPPASHHDD